MVPNAIIDAVSHRGVRHVDMPGHASRAWAAISKATEDEVNQPAPKTAGVVDQRGPARCTGGRSPKA
jgi:hypothetical protein